MAGGRNPGLKIILAGIMGELYQCTRMVLDM